MLVDMALADVPEGRADGIESDVDVHVAQSLGGRELTVTIRRVGPVLEPLHVDVLKQPGPPLALSWLVGLTPLALTFAFFAAVWIRTGRHRNAHTDP